MIQACRGFDSPEMVSSDNKSNSDTETDAKDNDNDINYRYNHHPDADMLVIRSNTKGYKSYRNRITGSLLITATTKMFTI